MTRLYSLVVGLLFPFVVGCARQSAHFIEENDYRAQLEKDFDARKLSLEDTGLFNVFSSDSLTQLEREELMFLFAYMPLADIADYPTSFHLQNLRVTNQARSELSWGNKVPAKLFRHFVLPLRVNNEHLDNARTVFYNELKPRVQNLSMQEAILEVNHWCHEKVVYQPTDGRTSSPLATVKTAYGRCGEESTLLVAALRAVGIPARQVYTPRWAHTDDNHAWVEAWADGQWYFLGACEPEPVLDLGWFNAPASRGMLMNTKVFGKYDGPEEVIARTPNTTEINVTQKYAPVATLRVKVTDAMGQPVKGASVEYKLYNYAEYYTIATKTSDSLGYAELSTGLGDLMVWVSKNGNYGVAKASVGKDKEVVVALAETANAIANQDIDIIPPTENAKQPEVTNEQRLQNNKRLAAEDSIRALYVATMYTEESAKQAIEQLTTGDASLDARMAKYLVAARGNHDTIYDFLMSAIRTDRAKQADELLGVLTSKDLRDITPDVLWDNMDNTPTVKGAMCPIQSLLNPRVATEHLIPYKRFLQQVWTGTPNPTASELIQWVKENIQVADSLNALKIQMSPQAVWLTKKADAKSRDEFFVALARSLGVPAWIDGITGQLQYQELTENLPPSHPTVTASISGKLVTDSRICTVQWEQTHEDRVATGTLRANYTPTRFVKDPEYYTHFTLSKIKDGRLVLLNLDEKATWASTLKAGLRLEAGKYLLVTGTRLANGSVLSRSQVLEVFPNKETVTTLLLRQDESSVQVIGHFNSESKYLPVGQSAPVSILSQTGRGYFVVGILGVGQEPTNHALKDIMARKQELDAWGRPMLLLFSSEEQYNKFQQEQHKELPANLLLGIDEYGIAEQIANNLGLNKPYTLPLFIISDTFNRVVFMTNGYTIGLGDQLLQTIHGL